MGATKEQLFTAYQNTIAGYAKALAHPARIAILQHLSRIDSCVCGDLVIDIGLAQPTVSQHLKALKNAGLIKGTVAGAKVCYCIDDQAWELLKTEWSAFFDWVNTPKSPKCC